MAAEMVENETYKSSDSAREAFEGFVDKLER